MRRSKVVFMWSCQSKFEGSHLDWQRLWSEFGNQIDRSEILQVSPPFTTEEHEKAENINKCLNTAKIVKLKNAHIQVLIPLPTINNSNPLKINETYKNLVTHVAALETMGKVRDKKRLRAVNTRQTSRYQILLSKSRW